MPQRTSQWSRLYPETSTVLAANGVINGASHDTTLAPADSDTINGKWSKFRAFAGSDQAGTLTIQQSADATNWYQVATASTTANNGAVLESLVCLRYVRAVFTNGATLQTKFEFDTVLVSI